MGLSFVTSIKITKNIGFLISLQTYLDDVFCVFPILTSNLVSNVTVMFVLFHSLFLLLPY